MTIAQLIETLLKFDLKTKVLIEAQEYGLHEVGSADQTLVSFDVRENRGWTGPHTEDKEGVVAVVLHKKLVDYD